jgi:hypothetical protein
MLPLLARRLRSFFPGIQPHDLYRYTSLAALLDGWDGGAAGKGSNESVPKGLGAPGAPINLHVLGWGMLLPPSITNDAALWQALTAGACGISSPPEHFKHCPHDAGYLHPSFDAKASAQAAKLAGVDQGEVT